MKKIICYIDGYNLYYGMRSKYGKKYIWLNVQALVENFLKPNMKLIEVKYFTAISNSEEGRKERQEIYLKALKKTCSKLSIHYGKFLKKNKKCPHCKEINTIYEEKQTDVNIASHLLRDFYKKEFDHCYLISGDSDLIPPVEIINKEYNIMTIAFPPDRVSKEMKHKFNTFNISKQKLRDCQLPLEIKKDHKVMIKKPSTWEAKR